MAFLIFEDTAQELEKQRKQTATSPTPPSLRPGGGDRNQPVQAEPQPPTPPSLRPGGRDRNEPQPTPPTPPSLRPGGAPSAPSPPQPPSLRPGGQPRSAPPPPPTPPTPPSLRPGGRPRGPVVGPQIGPQPPAPPSLRPGGAPRPGPQPPGGRPTPPSLRPGGRDRNAPPSGRAAPPTPPSLRPGGRDRNVPPPPGGRAQPPRPPSLRPGGRDRNVPPPPSGRQGPPQGRPTPPTPPSLREGGRDRAIAPPAPPSLRPGGRDRNEPPRGRPTPPTPPSLRQGAQGPTGELPPSLRPGSQRDAQRDALRRAADTIRNILSAPEPPDFSGAEAHPITGFTPQRGRIAYQNAYEQGMETGTPGLLGRNDAWAVAQPWFQESYTGPAPPSMRPGSPGERTWEEAIRDAGQDPKTVARDVVNSVLRQQTQFAGAEPHPIAMLQSPKRVAPVLAQGREIPTHDGQHDRDNAFNNFLKRVGEEAFKAMDVADQTFFDLTGIRDPVTLGRSVYDLFRGETTPGFLEGIEDSPTVQNIREAEGFGDFYNRQLEAFEDAPLYEQLGRSLFSPQNLIGGGLATRGLRGGAEALEQTGRLGNIAGRGLRGGARANEALDVAQGRLIGAPVDAIRRARRGADEGVVPIRGGSIHTQPGRRARGGIEAAPQTAPQRPGEFLAPRTAEELGENYKAKDVLRVANDLENQREAAVNRINSEVTQAIRNLGGVQKDGHHLKNVPGNPSAYDVIENPSQYTLNVRQRRGVEQIRNITESIRRERQAFGVPPQRLLDISDEGGFVHRKVLETPEGELGQAPAGGGARLGGGRSERSRVFDTVAEAEEAGVKYAPLRESMREHAQKWLKASADEHVKDLLVPFSETSAMRVPPALREQMDTLRSQARSLQDSGVRLERKQEQALDAFLAADEPNVDALRDTLDNIRITKGQFQGQDIKQARETLRDLKRQVKDLAPEWRQAVERSRSPRPGRRIVGQELAPALSGRDFDEDTWKRIDNYYGERAPKKGTRERVFRGATRGVTAPLRFVQATMDPSALLRQQAPAAATHPVQYLRNTAKGFRDVVDSRGYDALMSSPKAKRAARHGIAIFGDSAEAHEFQAPTWLHRVLGRVPGVREPFRWADNHFIRFNSRQRVDLFDLEAEILERKLKRPPTERELDQVAHSINRLTGVSVSRPTDLETDMMFAARYTRSSIESVMKLASRGDIEGQLARKYLGRLVGVSATLATAAALAQGRDPREVLNPIDVRDGRVQLNPNFLATRAYGHDMKPLGTFDSLARLASVAGDAMWGAIKEKDAKELFDFIGYATSTKGNPLVSFASDLVQGQDFNYRDPLSARSVGGRFMPFTIDALVNELQAANLNDPDEVARVLFGVGMEGLGLKTTPLSFSEVRDQVAQQKFSKPYDQLDRAQQRQVNENERVKRLERQFPDDLGTVDQRTTGAFQRLEEVRTEQEERLRTELEAGLSGAERREAIQEFKQERYQASQTLISEEISENIDTEPSTMKDALAEKYWSAPAPIDPETGQPDFDQRRRVQEQVLEDARKRGIDTEYITGTGPDSYLDTRYEDPVVREAVQEYEQDVEYIVETGYWDAGDEVAKRVAQKHEQLPDSIQTQDELYGHVRGKWEEQALDKGLEPNSAEYIAYVEQGVNTTLQRVDWPEWFGTVRDRFRERDPRLRELLIKWGYKTPSEEDVRDLTGE